MRMIFPVRVGEIAYPRVSGESFLKVFTPIRRSSTTSSSEDLEGTSNAPLVVQFRNLGETPITFTVMGAMRAHLAESQGSYSAIAGLTDIQVVAYGIGQITIPTTSLNLFSFVLTSSNQGKIKVDIASASEVTVWKALEREDEKGTHLDTFLKDEDPKEFISTSSPSS